MAVSESSADIDERHVDIDEPLNGTVEVLASRNQTSMASANGTDPEAGSDASINMDAVLASHRISSFAKRDGRGPSSLDVGIQDGASVYGKPAVVMETPITVDVVGVDQCDFLELPHVLAGEEKVPDQYLDGGLLPSVSSDAVRILATGTESDSSKAGIVDSAADEVVSKFTAHPDTRGSNDIACGQAEGDRNTNESMDVEVSNEFQSDLNDARISEQMTLDTDEDYGTDPHSAKLLTEMASAVPDGFSFESLEKCAQDLASNPRLNDSQRDAIGAAMIQTCTLIQGPPGTGKTTASVQVLRMWSAMGLKPLLVTSNGNTAVDNIAEGLIKAGLNVVRLGRSEKLGATMDNVSLDAKVEVQIDLKTQELREKMKQDVNEKVSASTQSFREWLPTRTDAELEAEVKTLGGSIGKRSWVVSGCEAWPVLNGRYQEVDDVRQKLGICCQQIYQSEDLSSEKLETHRSYMENLKHELRSTRKELKSARKELKNTKPFKQGLGKSTAKQKKKMAKKMAQVSELEAKLKHLESLEVSGYTENPRTCAVVRFVPAPSDTTITEQHHPNGTVLEPGWHIYQDVDKIVGYCSSMSETPPNSGWSFRTGDGELVADSGAKLHLDRESIERLALAAFEKRERETADLEIQNCPPQNHSRAQIQRNVLAQADVICCQMISAGSGFLDSLGPFAGVLVDEVAQSTEPSVIVPIVARRCARLVLVGDHFQLPPTVHSDEAVMRGMTQSLFARLIAQGTHSAPPFHVCTSLCAPHWLTLQFCRDQATFS